MSGIDMKKWSTLTVFIDELKSMTEEEWGAVYETIVKRKAAMEIDRLLCENIMDHFNFSPSDLSKEELVEFSRAVSDNNQEILDLFREYVKKDV